MTGSEHARMAERLLDNYHATMAASLDVSLDDTALHAEIQKTAALNAGTLAAAQVHATLALASTASTALHRSRSSAAL